MVMSKNEFVNNNRITWVDIAKGLLILIVVWSHVPSIALSQRLGLHHEGLNIMGKLMFIFNCFFMHAFFVLSGYTTNFKKNFTEFFYSSFKSLIIPAFCFSIITCLLYSLLFQDLYFVHLVFSKEYWCTGFLFFWFLDALFLSRLFCYLLVKLVKNDIIGGVFCLL